MLFVTLLLRTKQKSAFPHFSPSSFIMYLTYLGDNLPTEKRYLGVWSLPLT